MAQPSHRMLPRDFPAHLSAQAWDLEQQGILELAWAYPVILEVITALAKQDHAILGGDVYRQSDGMLYSTGDGWFLDRLGTASWADYVRNSEIKASNYIERFHARNGDGFWFVPVAAAEGSQSHAQR